MKKLLLIALAAMGLLLVPVQRSDAQITIGVGGVGFGYPGYRSGYYPYGSGYGYGNYPYGSYRPYRSNSYYSGRSYYNGHRYNRRHRHNHYYRY